MFLKDFHTLQSVLSLLYFFISSLNGFLYGVNSFVHAASNGFLTNEIEGVVSTRKDINEILENVEDKNKRLTGLVNKYLKLCSEENIESAAPSWSKIGGAG